MPPGSASSTDALRAVVQRVLHARVTPGGEIGAGLSILLGIAAADDESAADRLAGKVARLRVFEDAEGKFATSLLETGGEALVVSQFTLIADSKRQKGTRPDFSGAAKKEVAEPLYERFCEQLRALGVPTSTGVFGARMTLEVVNEGPVTIILDVYAAFWSAWFRASMSRISSNAVSSSDFVAISRESLRTSAQKR